MFLFELFTFTLVINLSAFIYDIKHELFKKILLNLLFGKQNIWNANIINFFFKYENLRKILVILMKITILSNRLKRKDKIINKNLFC